MSTTQEKTSAFPGFVKTKSDIQAQWNFRLKYKRGPPLMLANSSWHKKSIETGSVLQRKRDGRP